MAQEFSSQLSKDRRKLDDELKQSPQDSTGEQSSKKLERAALERKWFVIFASRLVLQKVFGPDKYRNILRKFYKGDWRLGEEKEGKFFLKVYDFAKSGATWCYKKAARQAGFNHRNWTRDPNTVGDLQDFLSSIPIDISAP